MHPVAHFALAASIVTSALGGVILCVLVFRFGFTPDEDESAEERTRRFFATRLGHATGAVCFALTAGLAVVAGVVQWRSAAGPEPEPAALARPAPEPTPAAAASDVVALREAQERTLGELRSLEERVKTAESALGSMRETAAAMVARIERGERARERAAAATQRTGRPVERSAPERSAPERRAPERRAPDGGAPALSLPPRTGPISEPGEARLPERQLPATDAKPAVPRAIQVPLGTFDSTPPLVETPPHQASGTREPSQYRASVTRELSSPSATSDVALPSATPPPTSMEPSRSPIAPATPAPPAPPARRPEAPRQLDKAGAAFAREAARTVARFADDVKDGMVAFGRRVRQFVEEELR